jgi:Secretion system C-terminal sorting domain/HmuY protein
MKKILLLIVVLAGCTMTNVNAQVVSETVSINPNYPSQVYYSMQNGASPAVDNTNWDLAFQLRGFGASILINSKNNVKVYRADKAVSSWASMTASDTTGILNSSYELMNSDISWDMGALNGTYDSTNAFDLGWGVYDFVTHAVVGDSLYFLKLSNGTYKKLWIESLTTGIYYFRWADLDGTNEIAATLNKTDFPSKYFGYYSIVNNVWIDREPVNYNQWDLLFTQYLAITPVVYKVTGVLSNDSVFVEKAHPVNVSTVSPTGNSSMDMNVIGYNWKTYDFANNIWAIEDSLVYFVKDRSAAIWKVIFTGFGGAANGNYEFTKEFLGTVGVAENNLNPLITLYPNPASETVNLVIAKQSLMNDAEYRIINVLGEVVKSGMINISSELNTVSFDINDLNKGMYILSVNQSGINSTRTFIVQ